ncbi:MAG TPA: metallophosphoesterase [Candidatus Sulfotelmatobacter sp.]|nr:metallophosphoesterase [Candidatus Sulfotelmatobacter sp.]
MKPAAHPCRQRPILVALCLSLLLWAGWMPARSQGWKFLVVGDTLRIDPANPINTNLVTELANAITNEAPAFVLIAGDLIYAGGEPLFQQWTNLMAPVYQAGIGVYPAVGNHDIDYLESFTNVFGPSLPDNGPVDELDTTYALAYSNALVLVFNEFSATNDYRINQPWLEALLATNTRPHIFALGHMPAFKVLHPDCLAYYPTNRNLFWNSLSNAHARIYFCGHDHFYDHSRLDEGDGNPDNDLHQIIVGTGGAPLYPDGAYDGPNDRWTPQRVFHEAQFGYVSVEVDQDLVRTTWHHRTGTNSFAATAEIFTYSLAPRPALHFSYSGAQLVLTWSGDFRLEVAPESSGPFTPVPEATSPHVAGLAKASKTFYRLARSAPGL